MKTDNLSAEDILLVYKDDVFTLAAYLPWLEKNIDHDVSTFYKQNGVDKNTVSFPVYDSTLMNFIKAASNTEFMDRNYPYIYSRNGIRGLADEMALIDRATIFEMEELGGILSHYILGGRTKARLWNDGVSYGVFYEAVKKAKELVDFWINATQVKGDS